MRVNDINNEVLEVLNKYVDTINSAVRSDATILPEKVMELKKLSDYVVNVIRKINAISETKRSPKVGCDGSALPNMMGHVVYTSNNEITISTLMEDSHMVFNGEGDSNSITTNEAEWIATDWAIRR